MARVKSKPARRKPIAMPVGGAAAQKQRKHKIIVESVTQEKSKLRTVLTFHAQPPAGYTFIPAGNPELTTAMKEFARQGHHKIYAVTTTPHQKMHDLSKEVHRIGFHFPSIVVAQVCAHYGIVLSSQGTLITEDVEDFRKRRSGRIKNDADQITINTQARNAIKDLFPKMPDNDLHTIIKTAFQKGQGKVGTAIELTLVRRAQLSVVAHIRHVYTAYDQLLRQCGYQEARAQVEAKTLKKLVEWRGDDDGDNKVLEDVIREVVVISDDEESDEDGNDTRQLDQRDLSVEIVSSQANSRQADRRDINQMPLGRQREQVYVSDEDDVYRYIPQTTKRRKTAQDPGTQITASSQYLHAAWDRARKQYRDEPEQMRPLPLVDLVEYDPRQYDRAADNHYHNPPRQALREVPSAQHTPDMQYQYTQGRTVTRPSPPRVFRGADGALYERVIPDTPVDRLMRRPSLVTRPSYAPQQDSGRSQMEPAQRPARMLEESPRFRDGDNTVVPSIESPQYSPTSRNPVHEYQAAPVARRQRDGDQVIQSRDSRPQVIEIVDLSDNNELRFQKRRRIHHPAAPGQLGMNPFDQGERTINTQGLRGDQQDTRLCASADRGRVLDVQLPYQAPTTQPMLYRTPAQVPSHASHIVDISPATAFSAHPRRIVLPAPQSTPGTRQVIDLSSPDTAGPRRVYMAEDGPVVELRSAPERNIRPERVPYLPEVRTVPVRYHDDQTAIRPYTTQQRREQVPIVELQSEEHRGPDQVRYETRQGVARRIFTDPSSQTPSQWYEPLLERHALE